MGKKIIIILSLLIFVVTVGVGASSQDVDNMEAEKLNFFEDFSNTMTIDLSIQEEITEDASLFYKDSGVGFYTIILPSEDNKSLNESLKQILSSYSAEELENNIYNFFIYNKRSGEYKLFLSNNIIEKINYYTINNIIKNFDQHTNVSKSFKETIPSLIRYLIIAGNAVTRGNQFNINNENTVNNPSIEIINIKDYINYHPEEENSQVSVVQNENLPKENKNNSNSSLLIFGIIIIVVILLLVGLFIFFKVRSNKNENEGIVVVEDDPEGEYFD